ncbi:MAG: hypothetical protein ACOCV2_15715 [Persicimonas sp.]
MKIRNPKVSKHLKIVAVIVTVCTAGVGYACDKKSESAGDDGGEDSIAEFVEAADQEELDEVDQPEQLETGEPTSDALSEPITYTFPDVFSAAGGEEEVLFTVYQDASVAVLSQHERNDDPDFSRMQGGVDWFAGHPTDGRLATQRPLGEGVYRIEGASDYDPDRRYRREHFGDVDYYGFDRLEVDVERGDDTREIAGVETVDYRVDVRFRERRWNDDEELAEENDNHYETVLWVDEDRPFNPAPLGALDYGNSFFVEHGQDYKPDIGHHAYYEEGIEERLEDAGLILGLEIYTHAEGGNEPDDDEPDFEMIAEQVETTDPIEDLIPWRPVVPSKFSEQAEAALLSMNFAGVKKPEAAEGSQFGLRWDGAQSGAAGGDDSAAVWATNDKDDFALYLTAPIDDDSDVDHRVLVKLMRPLGGMPSEGSWEVAPPPDAPSELSDDEFDKVTEQFQLLAVIVEQPPGDNEGIAYPVGEVREGTLQVTEEPDDDGDMLAGQFEIEAEAWVVGDGSGVEPFDVELQGRFEAIEGLEALGDVSFSSELEPR